MLTPETIQELANRPDVKKTAVENFLGTLEAGRSMTLQDTLHNLVDDANAYRWNDETIRAILEGVRMYFEGAEEIAPSD